MAALPDKRMKQIFGIVAVVVAVASTAQAQLRGVKADIETLVESDVVHAPGTVRAAASR